MLQQDTSSLERDGGAAAFNDDTIAFRPLPSSTTVAPPETAPARLAIGLISLACLPIAGTALLIGARAVSAPALILFALLGVGSAPWQFATRLRLPGRLALSALTAFAVLTFGSMAMLAMQWWAPVPTFAVVTVLAVASHLAAIWRSRAAVPPNFLWRRLRPASTDVSEGFATSGAGMRTPHASILLAAAGSALCLGSAVTHRHLDPGFGGFLVQIGPWWFVGLAAILAALAWAPRGDEKYAAIIVALLTVVLTLTPALVYDAPRSQSAAKHVDLLQRIRYRHDITSIQDIYRDWRGFFTATAWLADIAGIRDPLVLATFWPPILGMFRLAALRHLFGRVHANGYLCWIGVALAVLADPIGADYFSPQSVGFVIGLIGFGIALHQPGHEPAGVAIETVAGDNWRWIRPTLLLLAGMLLAVSHQLSPFIVGGVLIILVVFRQVRPWWTPLLILGPAGTWAFAHRSTVSSFISIDQALQIGNFRPPPTAANPGIGRMPIIAETSLALLLGILVVAAAALLGLAFHRRERRLWAFAACPTAGLVIVALTPYGQEGVFRAALFGIPWLALLGALAFEKGRWRAVNVPLAVTAVLLVLTFTTASFGLDAFNVIRHSDLTALQYFQKRSGPDLATRHYLLNVGDGDLPWQAPETDPRRTVLDRISFKSITESGSQTNPDHEMAAITAELLRYAGKGEDVNVIWSPVSSKYDAAYGVESAAHFAALRDAFRSAPYWQIIFSEKGTLIFHFRADKYPAPNTRR